MILFTLIFLTGSGAFIIRLLNISRQYKMTIKESVLMPFLQFFSQKVVLMKSFSQKI